MKLWTESTKIPTLMLGLLIIALGALLYWEWEQGRALERQLVQLKTPPVTAAATAAVLPEFVLPNADTGFPEVVSRSLFTAARRSSGVAAAGGSRSMKKGQFALVGVMITPQKHAALLRDVQTQKTETVAKDGQVRGMTLIEVAPARVVLRQGTEVEELPLNVQIGIKAPVAPPIAGANAVPNAIGLPGANPQSPSRTSSMPAPAAVQPLPKPLEGASAPKNAPPNPPSRQPTP